MLYAKKVLTTKDVKKILCLGTNNTLALFKSEDFPSFRIGNRWFVAAEEFNKWIEEKGRTKAEVKI